MNLLLKYIVLNLATDDINYYYYLFFCIYIELNKIQIKNNILN